MLLIVAVTSAFLSVVTCQFDPHFQGNRSAIVHLFEWKWEDVARECEVHLGPNGVGGVQVSPPNENSVIEDRPWWERYQPVSYKIASRSGNENQFRNMVKRCAKVGVRIYVDAVINHMSATMGRGTAGSISDPTTMNYPGVPYTTSDFHPPCQIEDYNNPSQVRNCQLVGLPDLNHTLNWVSDRVTEYLNKLVDCGVAGFRVDAAKHMWPQDLKIMYSRVKNLSTESGFEPGLRPFIYQEVIDLGGEAISKYEYTDLGRVTEFRASAEIGRAFRGKNKLAFMDSWGPQWQFMNSSKAVVFVENHDNERGQGAGGADVLMYKDKKPYIMAVAFTLAYPFGVPKVMSSFEFEIIDQGPPMDRNENIISPGFVDDICGNGWVCQHREPQISKMILFRNLAADSPLNNWWSDGNNKIAFGREGKAFIAFNNDGDSGLEEILQTGLSAGFYCDIMTGEVDGQTCTGNIIEVAADGSAMIKISSEDSFGVVAINVANKIKVNKEYVIKFSGS